MDVIVHLSSGNVSDWEHALANVRNLLDDDSVATDEVAFLANGDAVRLLTRGTLGTERIRARTAEGVAFLACGNSLSTRDVGAERLVDGVAVVPSGVGELARRQADGAAYLKVP